ncbi:MAG: FtsX-like permease family protein [Defluviitaleaceae bacterium]|nr:FtsX-like permease family protein [Defluviitaleaceae bacterium]
MYLITNAIKNLVRNKGRNILLAAVTLAIIIGAVVTLTIHNAASRVIDEIRLDIGSRVTIEQDIMGMFRSGMGVEELAENTIHIPIHDWVRFADSAYLSNTIFNAEVFNLESESLLPVQATPPGTNILQDVPFRILGSSELDETLSDIIVHGRMFEGINEVVIDDELAHINNIELGDTIELNALLSTWGELAGRELADKPFELTVVGIYSADLYERPLFRFSDIFTSFETIASAGWESNLGLNMTAEYFLRNPDYLELFENEVRAKGLPDTYIVSINQPAYDRVAGPMLSMKSAVMTFSIVILILGSLVLALISFLVIRERKYEVGVLRAMGMERGKVAFGILTEAVVITTLCLVVGLGLGNAVAQPIANGLLGNRVAAAEARSEELQQDRVAAVVVFGGQMQSEHSIGYRPESEITVAISANVIIQIIIITLALAALSGIIGVVIITQYEPLKILRERS